MGFLGFQVEGLPPSIDNLMSTPPLFSSVVGTNSSTAFSRDADWSNDNYLTLVPIIMINQCMSEILKLRLMESGAEGLVNA